MIDIDPAFKVANENDMKIAQSEILAELIEQRYETEKIMKIQRFIYFQKCLLTAVMTARLSRLCLNYMEKP